MIMSDYKYNMLLVSAYYNIPSKASQFFYYENIKRFFEYVNIPLIFFTDESNYSILKEFAKENVMFHIQPFEDMGIFKEFSSDFWEHQITKDPEKYHTWQLGALWANKSGFVKQARELYPLHDWYMWVDIGSIRTDNWKPLLSDFGKRPLPSYPGVYLQQIRDIPNDNYFVFPFKAIAGSHILFHKDYIDKFIECYYCMLSEYERKNVSLISDQYIIASIVSQKKMDNLFTIKNNVYSPDEYFFFFSYF